MEKKIGLLKSEICVAKIGENLKFEEALKRKEKIIKTTQGKLYLSNDNLEISDKRRKLVRYIMALAHYFNLEVGVRF